MNIHRFTCNFIEENCYLLWDETQEAIFIDCGAHADEELVAIAEFVNQHGLHPVCHLLTHGHFDHTFGAQFLYDRYGLTPRLAKEDASLYYSAGEQTLLFLHRRIDYTVPPLGSPVADGDEIRFGSHMLRAIATPGHTPGGLCYYCEAESVLLSGDSLFRGSIGRCDLPGSNLHSLITALRERVKTLPQKTVVLPGHGPQTTINTEQNNPYLQ